MANKKTEKNIDNAIKQIKELKSKKVKSQFDSLLTIHKDRYKRAENIEDKDLMFSASVEIRRIETLIADEVKNKAKE